jgi:GTP-binding protein Era
VKSGFVSLIGRPNVGKSTLLNTLLGQKISIVTNKPQTTRNVIRGVYNRIDGKADDCQIVFIDTPGIHKPRTKLGESMTQAALNTFREVDLILLLVDGGLPDDPAHRYVLDQLAKVETPKLLAINKIDLLDPESFRSTYEAFRETGLFIDVFGLSALSGKNVPALLKTIVDQMEEGPPYFPESMITDHPERFLVREIIREKALRFLEEEVPHGIAVEIESYEEEPHITKIGAVIYCEKKSHKGIIIGKRGKKLKGIGKSAREEIEALLGVNVYLSLWVKVRENWRDSRFALRNLGYHNE